MIRCDKRFFQMWSVVGLMGAGVVCGSLIGSTPVMAGPSTSPSARAAAELKHDPPNNYLKHYLPDDRYKIEGKVWKYVSTQLDNYYHKPNSPLMLRQPANIVIGFPSAAAAEEAGYLPDPTVRAELAAGGPRSVASSGGSMGGIGGMMGGLPSGIKPRTTGKARIVNNSRRARRITLADRRSTISLPPGWQLLGSQTGTEREAGGRRFTVAVDVLRYGNDSKRVIVVGTTPLTGDLALAPRFLNAATIRAFVSQAQSNPNFPAEARAVFANTTVNDVRAGNARGIIQRGNSSLFGPGVSILATGGRKLVYFAMPSAAAKLPGSATILRSLQLR